MVAGLLQVVQLITDRDGPRRYCSACGSGHLVAANSRSVEIRPDRQAVYASSARAAAHVGDVSVWVAQTRPLMIPFQGIRVRRLGSAPRRFCSVAEWQHGERRFDVLVLVHAGGEVDVERDSAQDCQRMPDYH